MTLAKNLAHAQSDHMLILSLQSMEQMVGRGSHCYSCLRTNKAIHHDFTIYNQHVVYMSVLSSCGPQRRGPSRSPVIISMMSLGPCLKCLKISVRWIACNCLAFHLPIGHLYHLPSSLCNRYIMLMMRTDALCPFRILWFLTYGKHCNVRSR
jgi:hypothetical protein